MAYGFTAKGYNRKPLAVILRELEDRNIQDLEFDGEIIQTPQSPLGQINGVTAEIIYDLEGTFLDVVQSYDIDQAEDNRLDELSKIRRLKRGGMGDSTFRKAITNAGRGRIDTHDLESELRGVAGVTYAKVFTNDGWTRDQLGLEPATIAVAVIGGADTSVANTIRLGLAGGISTYGNTRVFSDIGGRSYQINLIRPFEVDLRLNLRVKISRSNMDTPAPSIFAIRDAVVSAWPEYRENGVSITKHLIQKIVYQKYSNVEVTDVYAERLNSDQTTDAGGISIFEIANIETDNVIVEASDA